MSKVKELIDKVEDVYKASNANEKEIKLRLAHVERVANLSLVMQKELGGDKEVLYASGILHDIAKFIDDKNHSSLGCHMSNMYTIQCNMTATQQLKVYKCIKNHNNRKLTKKERKRLSIEEAIIYDCDILDKVSVTRFIENYKINKMAKKLDKMTDIIKDYEKYIITDCGKKLFKKRIQSLIQLIESCENEINI